MIILISDIVLRGSLEYITYRFALINILPLPPCAGIAGNHHAGSSVTKGGKMLRHGQR